MAVATGSDLIGGASGSNCCGRGGSGGRSGSGGRGGSGGRSVDGKISIGGATVAAATEVVPVPATAFTKAAATVSLPVILAEARTVVVAAVVATAAQ